MARKIKFICDFCRGLKETTPFKVTIEIGKLKMKYQFCNVYDTRQGLNVVFRDLIEGFKTEMQKRNAEQKHEDNKN